MSMCTPLQGSPGSKVATRAWPPRYLAQGPGVSMGLEPATISWSVQSVDMKQTAMEILRSTFLVTCHHHPPLPQVDGGVKADTEACSPDDGLVWQRGEVAREGDEDVRW